jgi:hypothetical protein
LFLTTYFKENIMTEEYEQTIIKKTNLAHSEIPSIEQWFPDIDLVSSQEDPDNKGNLLICKRPSPHSLLRGLNNGDEKYSDQPLLDSHPTAYLITPSSDNEKLNKLMVIVYNKLGIKRLSEIFSSRVAEFEDFRLIHPLSRVPYKEQINLWPGYEVKPDEDNQPAHYAMVSTFDLAALRFNNQMRLDLSQPLIVRHYEIEREAAQSGRAPHVIDSYFLYLPLKCMSDVEKNPQKYLRFLTLFNPDNTYDGGNRYVNYRELLDDLLKNANQNTVLCFPVVDELVTNGFPPTALARNIEEELKARSLPVQRAQIFTFVTQTIRGNAKNYIINHEAIPGPMIFDHSLDEW